MATGIGNLPYVMPPVSPFDTITSQETNERIANIEAVADGTGIGDGAIDTVALAAGAVETAKINDDAVTSDKIDFSTSGKVWWEELGRVILGAPGTTLSLSSLPSKKYIRVLVVATVVTTPANLGLRFNNDTSNNYSSRTSINGAADSTSTSASFIELFTNSTGVYMSDVSIYNVSGTNKVVTGVTTSGGGAASGAPDREEIGGKWVNTSTPITRIDVLRTVGSGTYATGAELVVLGHD